MKSVKVYKGAPRPDGAPLRVLMVGNSFSLSVMKELPKIMEAQKRFALDITCMYIGGCSLERHIENWEQAKRDPGFRPYRIHRFLSGAGRFPVYDGNMPDMLAAPAYDLVTIQQASPVGFRRESWEPWGDLLVEGLRAALPDARFLIHQTWSYRSDAPRLAEWGMTQRGMFRRTRAVYADRAAHFGFAIIPVGEAVEFFRKEHLTRFVDFQKRELEKLTFPQLPPDDGDVVGQYRWKRDEAGRPVLSVDTTHLNRFGEYLQACVWFGALFGTDAREIGYAPSFVSPDTAALLRSCAARALAGKSAVRESRTERGED